MPQVMTNRIDEAMRARESFAAAFRRSRRGNLWREYDGDEGRRLTLCVFPRSGGFAWSIADREGVRFSRETFDEEDEAIGGLWHELEGWADMFQRR